jgi:hypothetical protein
VNTRFLNVVLLGCFLLMTGADRLQAEGNPANARVRRIVLQSRHLDAHGMGYSDRSLSELSRKLSPADVPTLIALLADRDIRVGVQFALASQCQASIVPVREAAKQHQMDSLDASDVMDLISGFAACPPNAKEEARAMRDEIDQLRRDDQARVAEEAKRKAEDEARIQQNSIKMLDPSRAKELTREEREEVYHSSLKAMGLDEKGPLTPGKNKWSTGCTARWCWGRLLRHPASDAGQRQNQSEPHMRALVCVHVESLRELSFRSVAVSRGICCFGAKADSSPINRCERQW